MRINIFIFQTSVAKIGNSHCKNGTHLQVEGCCTKDNPCEVNEGDCDSNEDCKGDLRCGQANCDAEKFGIKSKTDCCYEHIGNISLSWIGKI